jgi:hypothetical protein
MITERVDALIQLALITAASNDDWQQRQLGPIHFLKYVYLADLAYAKAHNGETYTGTPWKFHHFGPWANQVYNRIEPALAAIGAERIDIAGEYGEFVRWRSSGETGKDDIKVDLDFVATLSLEGAVRDYGSSTEDLLHHVYTTLPMLNAAPEDILDFSTVIKAPATREKKHVWTELSAGQLKRREKKRQAQKEELQKRFQNYKTAHGKKKDIPAPRYDKVYLEGVCHLDALAGPEVIEQSFTCAVSSEIWKSKSRYDPDLD